MLAFAKGQLEPVRLEIENLNWGLTNFLLDWKLLMGFLYSGLFGIQLLGATLAWFGSRGGTWTVIVTSIGTAATTGYVSAPIAVLTIVGAMQVLDQSDPFPSDEEFHRERGRG